VRSETDAAESGAYFTARTGAFANVRGERPLRSAVGIVGAGPAGLLLARLFHNAGIDSVVLESRDRARVERRRRA
jgi:p-hydroxybenzoate 3-monooxygenase